MHINFGRSLIVKEREWAGIAALKKQKNAAIRCVVKKTKKSSNPLRPIFFFGDCYKRAPVVLLFAALKNNGKVICVQFSTWARFFLNVCVCVCVRARIYIYIQILYIHTHTKTHTHIEYIYIYIYIYIYVRL